MKEFPKNRRQMSEKIDRMLHMHSPTPVLKPEVSYQPTPWLAGGILWRVQEVSWDDRAAMFIMGHLATGTIVKLDGSSAPIHHFNQSVSLQIAKKSHALAYAKFFGDFVHGAEGAFRIIQDDFDLLACNGGDQFNWNQHDELLSKTKIKSCKKGWMLKTNVLYGTALFQAKFLIQKNGLLEMLDDKPLIDDISVNSAIVLV